jgi:ABC-type Co2+ transport system permease subunit
MPKIKPKFAQNCTWLLLLLQASFISISWYFSWCASTLFDYKAAASGDLAAAEIYQDIAELFFCAWLSTIAIALILGLLFHSQNRNRLYLSAVFLLPMGEFMLFTIAGLFSY